MAITIIHLDGPRAGQAQQFDDSVDLITFGRSPECLVVYPLECTEVGRKHFALRRTRSGEYLVALFPNRHVTIDGIIAVNGMPVVSGSLIVLGRANGPRLRVEFRADMRDVMAEIAWDSPEPIENDDDLASETAIDLLFKRKELVPAAIAGLTEAAAAAVPRFRDVEVCAEYAPEAPMGGRSSLFWWAAVALALGAGAMAYFLFGRGAALGAALGKLLPAIVPPPPAKGGGSGIVDVSVFGPVRLQAGNEGLVQVFLHTLGQREIATVLAREIDSETTRRGLQTLATEIAQGQRVEIMLDARGLGVDQEMQTLIWRGEPCACQFTVSAPEAASGRTFHPRVLVLVDSVPVGSLTFALKITKEATGAATELRGDRARRYTYAFLSYASPDRAEVIKRAQGLKAGGTNFFNDLLSLEPGERWEQRLYTEIDRCDVFYLFWSSKAKASDGVMKEVEYALARRRASEAGDPDIIPIIIEGPPPPTPPDSLKDIHFNDSLTYVLAGIEGRQTGAR